MSPPVAMNRPLSDTVTFGPKTGPIIGPVVGGLILSAFAAFFVCIPILLPTSPRAASTPVMLLMIPALTGGFLGLLAVWLFHQAVMVARMKMEAGPDGLRLAAGLYDWHLWGWWVVREARLTWDEIRAVRLWQLPNHTAPDGVQSNYVVYTSRGDFVLSNLTWPGVAQMAGLLLERTGLPLAHSLVDLPPELAKGARPSAAATASVLMVHGVGWAASLMGGLALVAAVLLLVAQAWGAALRLLLFGALMLGLGPALRRYRLD